MFRFVSKQVAEIAFGSVTVAININAFVLQRKHEQFCQKVGQLTRKMCQLLTSISSPL